MRADRECRSATVPEVTLPTLLAEHGFEEISFLRQDCEDCKVATIPAWIASSLTARVQFWKGEFHPEFVAKGMLSAEQVWHACSLLCSYGRIGKTQEKDEWVHFEDVACELCASPA